jgi:hypothetical protein
MTRSTQRGGSHEVGEPSYDINALAGAVIAVGERRQAEHGDLGAVAAVYGLDAGDLSVVMDHQERQLAACSAPDAMVAGILIGVALARGETPPDGTPLPDWVRRLG